MPDVAHVTHLTVIQHCQYVRKCLISRKQLHHIVLSISERNTVHRIDHHQVATVK